MANFNVEGAQNVEISKKLPCEKPLIVQLEIMERYTAVHKACAALPKEIREVECLKVLYPTLFRKITDQDLIAGRTDFLPIGFGCVTSLGGVGHYCVFKKLRAFQLQLDETERKRVDALYDYWLDHDLKTQFNKEVLTEDTLGMFIDCEYPMIATARLSGMMLDYPKLLDKGIGGLRSDLQEKLKEQPDNNFYKAGIQCLDIFVDCASHLQQDAREQMASANMKRQKELERICQALENIKEKKPGTFHEAMQLFWLFALLAGVINYGRLDDYLGPYLVADLKSGRLTDEEAYRYIHSLWTMIENRRTTVNGRIIVGGKGRKHPKLAGMIGLSRNSVINYLQNLDKAELLKLLYSDLLSVKKMQKPDKIYLQNPNLLYAIASAPVQIGTARETFVVNQLSVNHNVEYGKTKGDFIVDHAYTFEVGGADKTFKQIADLPDSFILADNLEFATGKKLPLWIVGLTY